MQTDPNLFRRVFRFPAGSQRTPEENLATEVMAHLLEASPALRRKVLDRAGISYSVDDWQVRTQEAIQDVGAPWHGSIPDLVLASIKESTEVVIEVKLDAGTTYRKVNGEWLPQTEVYARWLRARSETGCLRRGILALLTRWSPPADLRAPADVGVRFTEVRDWLKQLPLGEDPATLELARQWAAYLDERRWAMVQPGSDHVAAIAKLEEFEAWSCDVAEAARERSLSRGWRAKAGTRAGGGRLGTGKYYFAAAIQHPQRGKRGHVQLGFWYGQDQGRTAVYPTVYVNGPSPDWTGHRSLSPYAEYEPVWNGWLIYLADFCPALVQEPCQDASSLALEAFEDALANLLKSRED